MGLRVLIVHEHLAYGEALQAVIDAQEDLECVGLATTVDDARHRARQLDPDVVLLDIDLAGSGELTARQLGARLVAMTADISVDAYDRAADMGATGFAGKEASVTEVLDSVRNAGTHMMVGGTTLELLLADARGYLDLTTARMRGLPSDVKLTERERQVLRLMREGLDAKSIAASLYLSVHTARSHIKKVLAKLGAHSQLEAVAIANRLGLDTDERRT